MIRFSAVAAVSVVIYSGMMILCVSGLGLDAKVASANGYLAALPFNFLAHRQYTFVADGAVGREVARFASVHAVNIAISVGAVGLAVDGFGLPYAFGMIATLLLVPLVTFILMNLWVFRNQRA